MWKKTLKIHISIRKRIRIRTGFYGASRSVGSAGRVLRAAASHRVKNVNIENVNFSTDRPAGTMDTHSESESDAGADERRLLIRNTAFYQIDMSISEKHQSASNNVLSVTH